MLPRIVKHQHKIRWNLDTHQWQIYTHFQGDSQQIKRWITTDQDTIAYYLDRHEAEIVSYEKPIDRDILIAILVEALTVKKTDSEAIRAARKLLQIDAAIYANLKADTESKEAKESLQMVQFRMNQIERLEQGQKDPKLQQWEKEISSFDDSGIQDLGN